MGGCVINEVLSYVNRDGSTNCWVVFPASIDIPYNINTPADGDKYNVAFWVLPPIIVLGNVNVQVYWVHGVLPDTDIGGYWYDEFVILYPLVETLLFKYITGKLGVVVCILTEKKVEATGQYTHNDRV